MLCTETPISTVLLPAQLYPSPVPLLLYFFFFFFFFFYLHFLYVFRYSPFLSDTIPQVFIV